MRLSSFLVAAVAASDPFAHGIAGQNLVDVTDELGIDFVHRRGETEPYFMPAIMGSGGAFLDSDADGDLDVYLVQSGGANQLYRQNDDGTFTNVTPESGLGDTGYGMGVAVGDVNNDGHLDVFVTNYGLDQLYLGNDNGSFENATARSGIDSDGWSASSTFCDYDADGLLDLYVSRYVRYDSEKNCYKEDGRQEYCGPGDFEAETDRLFRNLGDGAFEDVSEHAGLTKIPAAGLGVVCADLTGDGRLDFLAANDKDPNHLWENRGADGFEENGVLWGVAYNARGQAEAGMGIALGDVDQDSDLDLYLTHFNSETNTLYRNEPGMGFDDATASFGLAAVTLKETGFGTGFFDADHDGDLDLIVANGRVWAGPAVAPSADAYAERNQIFVNDGTGRFSDMSAQEAAFAGDVAISRGLALGDFDEDGDLDVLVTNNHGRARLYRNSSRHPPERSLTVRAFDPSLRRDSHGAVVTLRTTRRKMVRLASRGKSYLSSSDSRAHFGFGAETKPTEIRVQWPDGREERFLPPTGARVFTANKGSGQRVKKTP